MVPVLNFGHIKLPRSGKELYKNWYGFVQNFCRKRSGGYLYCSIFSITLNFSFILLVLGHNEASQEWKIVNTKNFSTPIVRNTIHSTFRYVPFYFSTNYTTFGGQIPKTVYNPTN